MPLLRNLGQPTPCCRCSVFAETGWLRVVVCAAEQEKKCTAARPGQATPQAAWSVRHLLLFLSCDQSVSKLSCRLVFAVPGNVCLADAENVNEVGETAARRLVSTIVIGQVPCGRYGKKQNIHQQIIVTRGHGEFSFCSRYPSQKRSASAHLAYQVIRCPQQRLRPPGRCGLSGCRYGTVRTTRTQGAPVPGLPAEGKKANDKGSQVLGEAKTLEAESDPRCGTVTVRRTHPLG